MKINQAEPKPNQSQNKLAHSQMFVQELAEERTKSRFKLGPEIGLRCYLLIVEVAERRVLGSLSVPGIFQGPGDTVAFLPAALLVLELWLGLLSWLNCPFSGSFGRVLNGTRGPC